MTVLGKILILVNLVFSIAAAALVAMMYAPMMDALAKNKRLNEEVRVAVSARDTYADQLTKAQADADTRVKEAREEARLLRVQLKDEQGKVVQKDDELQGVKKNLADAERAIKVVQGQLDKRQQEVGLMEDMVKERDKKNGELAKQLTDEHQLAVQRGIQADTLNVRNKDLYAQLQEAQEQLKKRPGTGMNGTSTASATNPPPENVEGSVRQIDPSGLMALSIGSDSGLKKGHTLEVFRPNFENPLQSKYLGTIEVVEVSPKEAVARTRRRVSDIQVGDKVAASLTPR